MCFDFQLSDLIGETYNFSYRQQFLSDRSVYFQFWKKAPYPIRKLIGLYLFKPPHPIINFYPICPCKRVIEIIDRGTDECCRDDYCDLIKAYRQIIEKTLNSLGGGLDYRSNYVSPYAQWDAYRMGWE